MKKSLVLILLSTLAFLGIFTSFSAEPPKHPEWNSKTPVAQPQSNGKFECNKYAGYVADGVSNSLSNVCAKRCGTCDYYRVDGRREASAEFINSLKQLYCSEAGKNKIADTNAPTSRGAFQDDPNVLSIVKDATQKIQNDKSCNSTPPTQIESKKDAKILVCTANAPFPDTRYIQQVCPSLVGASGSADGTACNCYNCDGKLCKTMAEVRALCDKDGPGNSYIQHACPNLVGEADCVDGTACNCYNCNGLCKTLGEARRYCR
jgi:hypothetical protein